MFTSMILTRKQPQVTEKIGAEFPFTRYFYEYKEPEKADELLAQFMEIERGLSEKVSALLGNEAIK